MWPVLSVANKSDKEQNRPEIPQARQERNTAFHAGQEAPSVLNYLVKQVYAELSGP